LHKNARAASDEEFGRRLAGQFQQGCPFHQFAHHRQQLTALEIRSRKQLLPIDVQII